MSNLYWLMDEQMARLAPYFPKSHGKPPVERQQTNVSFTTMASFALTSGI